jgi:hypothetical protein
MRTGYNKSPMPSPSSGPPEHSNHLEHRLTVVEVTTEGHRGKISYLERAVAGLIYMSAALAVGKSGELVEKLSTILKLTR